jgi:predicted HTH transcriptional regulator
MAKRTFKKIREDIINLLKDRNEATPTQISQITDADFRTIKRHLIWLLGLEKIGKKTRGTKTYYFLKDSK